MKNNLVKFFIFLTIFALPLYLVRFPVFGVPTNVLEILVLVTFILYLAKCQCSFLSFYKDNKIICWSVLAIFVGMVVSTLVNDDWRTGFGIIKGWFAVPLIFVWVLYEEVKSEQNLKSIIKWLYLGIFWVAAVSLIYYFQGDLTYDGRLKAFYLSPNHLAMFLAPGLIIGLCWIRELYKRPKKNSFMGLWRLLWQPAYAKSRYTLLFLSLSTFVISLSLYLTYSYATWTAVVTSLLVVYLIRNREINKRIVLTGAIILLLVVVSQWNTEKFENLREFTRSSLESRVMIWKSAEKILSNNPVLGIGPGNFQDKYLEYQKYFSPYLEWAVPQPHNLYLAFWLQAGLLGLIGFLVIIVKWIRDTISVIKNSQLAAVMLGVMIYILLHGLFDTPYWKNDLALVFWVVIILGIIAVRLYRKEAKNL